VLPSWQQSALHVLSRHLNGAEAEVIESRNAACVGHPRGYGVSAHA